MGLCLSTRDWWSLAGYSAGRTGLHGAVFKHRGSPGLCVVCVHCGVVHDRVWGHHLRIHARDTDTSLTPSPHCLPMADRWPRQSVRLGRGVLLAQFLENSGVGPTGYLAGRDKHGRSASMPPCEHGATKEPEMSADSNLT